MSEITLVNSALSIHINGNPVKIHQHEGRNFIEAKENSEFEINIKNNHLNRILAHASVDGIDVLTGKEALNNDSGGYVIDGNSAFKIKGYRYSDNKVAAFKFTKKENSYLKEKTGTSLNCGIIAAKIWAEFVESPTVEYRYIYNNYLGHPWPYTNFWDWHYPYSTGGTNIMYSCSSNSLGNFQGSAENSSNRATNSSDILHCCSMSNSLGNVQQHDGFPFTLGSTWGQEKESKVTGTQFKKGLYFGEINIYYSTRAELEKIGIVFKKEGKIVFPQGFKDGYCEPPKGWKT